MKWLKSLLGGGEEEKDVQLIDPNSILFTIPTISDDLPPLEPITTPPREDEPAMHEDDWCQVEFFHKNYVPELERLLKEYKVFEESNRETTTFSDGEKYFVWRKAYVRTVARQPLVSGDEPVGQLARIAGGHVGPAPVLFTTSSLSGRVKDGFTVRLGGNVDLYGHLVDGSVRVLAASVGSDPDNQVLVSAFTKLNAALGLVLVDWKAQFVLLDTNAGGQVKVWRP